MDQQWFECNECRFECESAGEFFVHVSRSHGISPDDWINSRFHPAKINECALWTAYRFELRLGERFYGRYTLMRDKPKPAPEVVEEGWF